MTNREFILQELAENTGLTEWDSFRPEEVKHIKKRMKLASNYSFLERKYQGDYAPIEEFYQECWKSLR